MADNKPSLHLSKMAAHDYQLIRWQEKVKMATNNHVTVNTKWLELINYKNVKHPIDS